MSSSRAGSRGGADSVACSTRSSHMLGLTAGAGAGGVGAMTGGAVPAGAVTVRGTDLDRIRRMAASVGGSATAGAGVLVVSSAEEEREAALRATRRALAAEHTARFPNTLAALRRKKKEDRVSRLAAEEAERCRLDAGEERLREVERARVLEAATATMIEATDKMKMLRNRHMDSYVGETRAAQIALAKRRAAAAAEEEAERHTELLASIAAGEAAEATKVTARQARTAEVAREQRRQLHAFIASKTAEMEAEREEGLRIAAKAQADAAAAAAEAERRRLAVVAANHEMQAANVELQRQKRLADAAAAAEARRQEEYAESKRVEAERKAALLEAKREEGARKARLIAEKVQAEVWAKMGSEEHRVAAAVAEAEAKSDALEAYRRSRQRQMHAEIAAHRTAARRKKEEEEAAARRAAAAEAARFAGNVAALEAFEAGEREARRHAARATQDFLLAQMADKKRVMEGAVEEKKAAGATAGLAACGAVESTAFTAFAAAAAALVGAEETKGHATLGLRRAIERSKKDPLIAATAVM